MVVALHIRIYIYTTVVRQRMSKALQIQYNWENSGRGPRTSAIVLPPLLSSVNIIPRSSTSHTKQKLSIAVSRTYQVKGQRNHLHREVTTVSRESERTPVRQQNAILYAV